MLTIRLEEPKRFEILDTAEPDSPGPDEVLVRIEHVGVCGTDIHAYHGRQPFFSYPRILGHELGVVIEEVGKGVETLAPGDRCSVEPYLAAPGDRAFERGKTNCSSSTQCLGVHVDGGMRERIILPSGKLHKSDILDTRSLALVEMLSIGSHAVERSTLLGDETVAVIGLGPIGLATLQFARSKAGKVVGIDISDQRLRACEGLFPGVHTLKGDPGQSVSEIWSREYGAFPEVVFDCTGSSKSMEQSIELPDYGGRIVLVGLCLDDISFSDPSFHRRELSIISSRNATAANFSEVLESLESGAINADQWITRECSPRSLPDVIEEWIQPDSGLIKGVIRFAG